MPDVTKPIDDNTFFILYVLTKRTEIEISKMYSFYNDSSYKNIINNLEILKNFGIEIRLAFDPSLDAPLDIIEKIEQNNEDICKCIEHLADIKSAIIKKIIPYAITCTFNCDVPEKLKEKIDKYLEASCESRKKYYYLHDIHLNVFKKVKDWASKTQTAPYKIGIDRFLERTGENNNSKYAFFHFLYELEKTKNIGISELNLSDDKPLVVFEKWKSKIHKSTKVKPRGNEIAPPFKTFHLYENGILNTAFPDNFCRCEDLEVKVFELFFNKPYNVSYSEIATVLGVEISEVSKRIYKNREKMKKVSILKNVKYFYNNQKDKTYSLIFQEK